MFADSREETGRKPIDYFSWGHIGMGVVVFLLWSLINLMSSLISGSLNLIVPFWFSIVLTIVTAIVWEIIENTLFLHIGIKFEDRRDSLINAIADIVFVIGGGLIMWGFKVLIVNILYQVDGILIFYIIGGLSVLTCLIGFLIGRAITLKKSK